LKIANRWFNAELALESTAENNAATVIVGLSGRLTKSRALGGFSLQSQKVCAIKRHLLRKHPIKNLTGDSILSLKSLS
jgi:hypothetical protein